MECDSAISITAAGVAREAVVRQYFEDHNVKDILERLLKELGEGMPRDPYRCIADWAYRQSAAAAATAHCLRGGDGGAVMGGQHGVSKETITPTDVPVSLPSSKGTSAVGSRTQSAHRLSQSSSARRPRRWNALLLGPEAARTHFFNALIDVSMEPSAAVEEHSRKVRELVRPFFPGKQTIRMVAHEIPPSGGCGGSSSNLNGMEEPSSVVFIDPKITSTTTEKNLFAMSVADVIVYCGERHTVPTVVGSDSIEKYLVVAQREGVRGVVAWCPDGGNLVSTASKLTLASDDGKGREAVAFPISSPPSKDALLQTMMDLPNEFLRPQHERPSPPAAPCADSAAPALFSSTATLEMECSIACLEGESIRVGDSLVAHCCGQRLETTVLTIDLVFSNRLPSNVVRRSCDAASGAEGAVVTVTVAPSDAAAPPTVSSVGLPVLTFVRTDEISEAVVAVIKAQLMSVHMEGRASPPFSSDEEDFEF